MARSKQGKSQTKKEDGKYRKETKEERRARLKEQQEAREQCMKSLPFALGGVLVLLVMFALYVRSVPPKAPQQKIDIMQQPPVTAQGVPEFMHVDTEPMVKEALEEATEALKEGRASDEAEEGDAQQEVKVPADETIEL